MKYFIGITILFVFYLIKDKKIKIMHSFFNYTIYLNLKAFYELIKFENSKLKFAFLVTGAD